MNLPHDVTAMLNTLLTGVSDILRENLIGVYLRGSLAMGDFIPETSDLDVLAATEDPVNHTEFRALASLHAQLAAQSNPYARRMEIAYIDRTALRRFQPGQCHPTLGQGEELAWSEHSDNWVLERWTVRERGVVLFGPPPKTLIDPVSTQELRSAVRARLSDWADWAGQPDDPDWLLPRSHKAYVVETMCRALDTLACGALRSKADAVEWAIVTLPEPWRSTVERSRAWRRDATPDPAVVPEVMRFVCWAAADGAILAEEEGDTQWE